MELTELDKDERLALAALMKAVVLADGHVSEDEVEHVEEIVDALGEEVYRAAMEEATRRFKSEDELKAFLGKIGRQEARDLIYGTLLETAMADAVEGREAAILEWLAKEWKVDVRIDAPPEDENG